MELERQLEALLFLAPDPVPVEELADALRVDEDEVVAGLRALAVALDGRGLMLRELAGGWTLGSHPDAEEAARRLLARPRTPGLTPAQAETLSIVAYLQPVSRPEVARIRGVASESATTALVDRGLIEEAGRSQFGAVLYRTTPLFLKLFGLKSVDELPDPARGRGARGQPARPRAGVAWVGLRASSTSCSCSAWWSRGRRRACGTRGAAACPRRAAARRSARTGGRVRRMRRAWGGG
jgi:segregation and condensation protein B